MTNLFFDVLPIEIQDYIYGLRLEKGLREIYYWRTKRKTDLHDQVRKHPYCRWNSTSIVGSQFGQIYYDPFSKHTCALLLTALNVLTQREYIGQGRTFWISQILRPTELGLIIFAHFVYQDGPGRLKYKKTNELCNRLIAKFNVRSMNSLQ